MTHNTKVNRKGFFITGTDTEVGKTIVTAALGLCLKQEGYDIGVMKPIQCSGDDAEFLKNTLDVSDPLEEINPYYTDEPLSPHIAFERANKEIHREEIIERYEQLKGNHDITLVEGAGGLLVPIQKDYCMIDLIEDLDLEVVIVSRLGLGTINHTLLTIEQLRSRGISIAGIIFNQMNNQSIGVAEQTNPDAIEQYGNVNILGSVPFLDDLSEKYILSNCQNTISLEKLLNPLEGNKTQELVQDDKGYVWHPFTQMQDWLEEDPLIIDQAKGNYLIDSDGNRYLDGVSSLWVNVHGHRKKEIDRAIKNQLNQLDHSTLLGLSNTPSIELAKKLVEITPEGLEKVFYSDSGSTAAEIAIKIAYQYWQNIGKTSKTNLVHLANSYHGDTLGSVSVGGIDLFHKVYEKLIFKTIQLDFPDCYRAPEGKSYPEYAFECLDKFEELLKEQHESIAALIVEPLVQGAAGMIVWPEGILKKMSELCRQHNVLLIVDEVATGFGRTGKMFACEHEDVQPDIMCLAKGITGGYLPLASTLTTKKIFDGFCFDYKEQKTFFHGHTYTGNPLCCSAALANLEVFEKERTLDQLEEKVEFLTERLDKLYELSHVGDIRQKGLMVGIELVEDKDTKKPFDWTQKMGVKVCQKIRERGVILRPLGNVIVLMPPLSITTKELDKIVSDTHWAIDEVLNIKREILK